MYLNWQRYARLTDLAAGEELHLGCTGAVADSDGAGEGDEVSRVHAVLLHERLLNVDNLVEADVGVERGLDRVKEHDTAVRSATTAVRTRISIWPERGMGE